MLHILPSVVNSVQHNCTIFFTSLYFSLQNSWRYHFVYVLCTSCSIGITLTKYKCKFRFCSARTNDIIQHFSDTNQQLHTAHVAYRYQSEPYSQTPHFAFIYFTKNAAFSTSQSKPVFAKNAPIKKTNDKNFKANRIYYEPTSLGS